MTTPKQKCEFTETRGNRLLRCQFTAIKSIMLEGETVWFCLNHYGAAQRMLKKKEQYEGLLNTSLEDIQKVIDHVRQLRQILSERGEQ